MDSLRLKAELTELKRLKDFIFKKCGNDPKIRLAVEEIFVNIVKYSNADYITVNIHYGVDLTIEFIDDGVKFDPTSKEEPKTPESLDETPVGGLGIHLARKNVDKMIYHYKNRKNHLKLILKKENYE